MMELSWRNSSTTPGKTELPKQIIIQNTVEVFEATQEEMLSVR
jgi:hypothetical protein